MTFLSVCGITTERGVHFEKTYVTCYPNYLSGKICQFMLPLDVYGRDSLGGCDAPSPSCYFNSLCDH